MKKSFTFILVNMIFVFGLCGALDVYAGENEKADYVNSQNESEEVKKKLDEYDFGEIDEFTKDNMGEDLDFSELLSDIISGKDTGNSKSIFHGLEKKIGDQVTFHKDSIVKVLMISVVSAFFTTFAMAFKNPQINDTSFFVTYMLLVTILLKAFLVIGEAASDILGKLCDFMTALLPSFTMAVGVSSGSRTAIAFYGMVLYAIMVVNMIFLKIILPAIHIYVILALVNSISKEDLLSKAIKLLETLIRWVNKTLLAGIIGINLIKNMVLPSIDAIKTTAFGKVLNVIPGVGDKAEGVTNIMFGTGRIIKNAMGTGALVIIILICLTPVIKLAVFTVCYQLAGAFVQPVTDKRIHEGICVVATGAKMLLGVVITVSVLFAVTIAIVCISTNLGGGIC